MAHPSLNRKSAIIINAILLFSLALIIIYKLILISEVKITKEIPIENETEVIKKEKIGNINTERIINANNEPQNWLSHGRDYHEQRYSPLNQINLETINKLELEWSLDMGTKRGLEATPIIDNGIMFVSSTWMWFMRLMPKQEKSCGYMTQMFQEVGQEKSVVMSLIGV